MEMPENIAETRNPVHMAELQLCFKRIGSFCRAAFLTNMALFWRGRTTLRLQRWSAVQPRMRRGMAWAAWAGFTAASNAAWVACWARRSASGRAWPKAR